MAKEVAVELIIDEDGTVHTRSEGTVGTECVELTNFMKRIKSFEILENSETDDAKKKNVQIVGKKQVKH